ncbi:hypothetical protein ACFQY5_03780 [Paeniroseomonas aquatica]|uniref:Glycosyltransferase RgtA/B/C/D-like domain-containing protein n=1 Tax=Paeniroseomonas aquatica TaxID=373043 RepID=A0ABT8AFI2_9PROT|nr:hypothetical protein [Paeniroseomonas aquatica]MDN3568536.1 hypothetical protein [Paeniroseomonas aquatica]
MAAADMGDTPDYLTLAPHRPPLYGWFLWTYRGLTGDLDHLPLVQLLLIAVPLLFFVLELGRLLRSGLVPVMAIILLLLHVGIRDTPAILQSESLYLAAVLAGFGFLLRFTRRGQGGLAAASICFALAATTRTTGTAFLLLPPLVALLHPAGSIRAAAGRAGRALAVAALVLALAMAGNWAKHGRFEIGSFAGIALVGKALLLIEPADLPDLPAAAASAVPVAAESRRLIAAQPDLAARLRAQMQALHDVRYPAFFAESEAHWPAWRDGDWTRRNQLALDVARRLIARHPGEFLTLWLRDWASLVLYPSFWPGWASADPPDPLAFLACRLHESCWALTRYPLRPHWYGTMLLSSLVGVVGGLAVILMATGRVLRRRASPAVVLAWAMAIVLHASLLLSAASEAGTVRYTVALHVIDVALLLWLTTGAIRILRGSAPARGEALATRPG